MQYTKQEIVTVANATFDAWVYLNDACDSLWAFWDHYFGRTDPASRSELVYDAQNRPDFVGNLLHGILHLLYEVKKELGVFLDPACPIVQAYLANVKEKQSIIDAQKETEE